MWCSWHHLTPVWNRWSSLNESQLGAFKHTHTHTHCSRTASVSWCVSRTSGRPPGHVWWCTPYVGASMWPVPSIRPVISTPVRLFIGLFPQLRGAGRSESPARELCPGLFSKETTHPSCLLIHPLTPWFQGLSIMESCQRPKVEICLCHAVKVTCQHRISPNDRLHPGKLPRDEWSGHLWTTMLRGSRLCHRGGDSWMSSRLVLENEGLPVFAGRAVHYSASGDLQASR